MVTSGLSGFLLAMGTRPFEEEVVVGWIRKVLVDSGWMYWECIFVLGKE